MRVTVEFMIHWWDDAPNENEIEELKNEYLQEGFTIEPWVNNGESCCIIKNMYYPVEGSHVVKKIHSSEVSHKASLSNKSEDDIDAMLRLAFDVDIVD